MEKFSDLFAGQDPELLSRQASDARFQELVSGFESFTEKLAKPSRIQNVQELPSWPLEWRSTIVPKMNIPSLSDILFQFTETKAVPETKSEEDSYAETVFKIQVDGKEMTVSYDGDSWWEIDSDGDEVGEVFFDWDEDSAREAYAEMLAQDDSFWADTIAELADSYASEADEETILQFSGREELGSLSDLPIGMRKILEDQHGMTFRPKALYVEE